MREIHTEIEIQAPAQKVWQLFTDFGSHARWNPYVVQWRGSAELGSKMELHARSGRNERVFTPVVIEHVQGRSLRYAGTMGPRFLFATDHVTEVVPLGEARCRFVNLERFSGLLVPVFWATLEREARPGFEAMNAALKAQAEKR